MSGNPNTRFFFAFAESEHRPNWHPVQKAVFFPYVQYASKYDRLERQLLDNYLWELLPKMENQNDVTDVIRHINLTIPDVMNVAKEAESRCVKFTKGCASDGLISALKVRTENKRCATFAALIKNRNNGSVFSQGFFLKYIDKYKDICNRLSQQISEKENWQLLKSCLSFQQVIGELRYFFFS